MLKALLTNYFQYSYGRNSIRVNSLLTWNLCVRIDQQMTRLGSDAVTIKHTSSKEEIKITNKDLHMYMVTVLYIQTCITLMNTYGTFNLIIDHKWPGSDAETIKNTLSKEELLRLHIKDLHVDSCVFTHALLL